MLKLPQLLALLTLFGLTACGGGGGSSASTSATSGYALSGQFQKGPFAIGSQISANELDAGLNPTGRVYNVQTADDLGRFTVPTRIENKLVELVGDGFYMDELTGQLSSARIQLRAIADLSLQQPVTVNILTSLQGLRLKRLIALGSTYTSADTQSRNEVLQAFGITPSNINSLSNLYSMQINGTTDQDAVLLAISSVISKMAANAAGTNGTSQPAELSNYVNTISSQIESSGFITNAAYITAMNLAASQVDLSSVRTNVINYYASRGVTVTPPNFEEWIDKAGTGQLPQRMGSGYAAGTGSLAAARSGHTSTLLANGKVLLAGGQGDLIAGARAPIRTSEIYDPNNGTWAATSNLAEARSHHTSVRLANGLVLVAGGTAGNGQTALTSAELFNPATGQWTATGSMNISRWGHTATLLNDGRVLVTGGDSNDAANASCEIFDPTTGQWTVTGSMSSRRMMHVATLMSNGKVLTVGGFGWPGGATSALSAEIFDPSSGTWSPTGTPISPRYGATITVLDSGKVLIVGGVGTNGSAILTSSELFDQTTGVWTASGTLISARFNHTATLLPSGRVLVIGGGADNGQPALSRSEIYNPSTGLWTLISTPLLTPRGNHTATLLANGKVLIAAGTITSGTAVTTALSELFWQ